MLVYTECRLSKGGKRRSHLFLLWKVKWDSLSTLCRHIGERRTDYFFFFLLCFSLTSAKWASSCHRFASLMAVLLHYIVRKMLSSTDGWNNVANCIQVLRFAKNIELDRWRHRMARVPWNNNFIPSLPSLWWKKFTDLKPSYCGRARVLVGNNVSNNSLMTRRYLVGSPMAYRCRSSCLQTKTT